MGAFKNMLVIEDSEYHRYLRIAGSTAGILQSLYNDMSKHKDDEERLANLNKLIRFTQPLYDDALYCLKKYKVPLGLSEDCPYIATFAKSLRDNGVNDWNVKCFIDYLKYNIQLV